ncbi:restriction endonuclease [Longibacter salinarum]|uniref:Restriction endonuclease n=1 Tax=Longibacter salinarum TaxID=1850348 RepID=A0A2A8CVZ6_9BACT|nr:type I restriction endonuclease [Longibacter salinarum]PEN12764.1 restriction endonuclease [Longibacter salinarum]
MDFIEEIASLSSRAISQIDHLETEEGTKNALVMPFIKALGYDPFDPTEVVPEFTADVGTKKGEKVDYAIKLEGRPVMLFECKHAGAPLDPDHADQLFRYFHVTEAKIGVLTNGLTYKFFTDLEQENKMDERPFLTFNLLHVNENKVGELKRLRKSSFDLDDMLSAAHDLKYRKALLEYLQTQWDEPEQEFVRFMTGQVYDGRITKNVRYQFSEIVHDALRQFVSDKIRGRLNTALAEEEAVTDDAFNEEDGVESEERVDSLPDGVIAKDGDVVTTEEEMEGFRIVRAIMREVVDVDRVVSRDVKSYFGILLDDNNRQPICRLRFETAQKYLGLFDEEKNEERVPIDAVDEIYDHADKLRQTVHFYDTE